jgi:hypothetical protein
MRKLNTNEPIHRMTVYFPSSLLEKVYDSADLHKRSFNKQVLWIVEQHLALAGNEKTPDRAGT